MTEREQVSGAGFEISERQAGFFKFIGMDIPAGARFTFSERQKEIMQKKVKGLTDREISEQLSITTSTIATYIDQVKANTSDFAIGSDLMKASISIWVGLGLINAQEIPESGVKLYRDEAQLIVLMVRGYNNNELVQAFGETLAIVSQRQRGIYEKFGIKNMYRGKALVAIGMAVSVLKAGFEKGEGI